MGASMEIVTDFFSVDQLTSKPLAMQGCVCLGAEVTSHYFLEMKALSARNMLWAVYPFGGGGRLF